MAAGPSLEDRDPRRGGRKGTGGGGGKSGSRSQPRRRGADGPRWLGVLRTVLWGGVICAFIGIAALVGMFSYFGSDPGLPQISKLDDFHPKQVTRILDRNGSPIGELGLEKRTVVPYAAIPQVLINAVVAAEDADYFHHEGIDYRGMLRAFIENVLRGRTAQGGSTITQQVVKTMLLSPERTMRRKIQEIILARQLSQKLSKEEVLALYLNQIYYGHGRYGCEEAARYFFGKSVRDVTLAEAALLAGLPQSPERLSPRKHPDAAKTRQRYVLGQMAEHGFIDRKIADKVAADPIRLAREPAAARGIAVEIVDGVGRFLSEHVGERAAYEGGLTVQTTVDGRLQELARQSLERGLEDLDVRQGFRGPSGHVAGKTLEKAHAALLAAHKGGPKESEIVEGIVLGVDGAEGAEASAAKAETKDKSAPAAKATKDVVKVGKDAVKATKDAAVKAGKLRVDLGAVEGVVDLGLEPRYAKGPKPLATRFKEGDLVHVRVASERPHTEGGPLPLALELGPQAAMVVMDPQTREVLALVGGYDYRPGGFDRTQRAHRQPGSAFKPIVYSAAIESRRITPATMINDSPEVYALWKPQNFEKEEFQGPVRVRTALAASINTVAIKVLSDVGIPEARAAATRLGITSPMADDLGLAMALGAMTVTPFELANVYATFASGGLRGEPVMIRAVGAEKQPPATLERALAPEAAYVMVSLLRSVIDEGTARAAAGKLRRPVAGKTGTTNRKTDTIDAWFVGFTPDLLAAVWVGFDDTRKLGRGETGARAALPIWLDFMTKAVIGRPTKDFIQPPGVVVQRIDKATGLLAPAGQDANTLDEVFLDGTAPTEQAPPAGQEQSADKLLMGE
jgi:penicillin-binding protein 1A